jgi:hypothetical protein
MLAHDIDRSAASLVVVRLRSPRLAGLVGAVEGVNDTSLLWRVLLHGALECWRVTVPGERLVSAAPLL